MILRFAMGALLLTAAPLAAQADERTDTRLRNECRLAAQVIRTGNPVPRRPWAYETISQCAESGPAVVADAWRQPATDERMIQQLTWATARLRNRQVFEAVSDAAREKRNGLLIRAYAMEALFGFANPGAFMRVRDLLDARAGGRPWIYRGSGDGKVANAPDLGDAAPEVRTILAEIVASDPKPGDGSYGPGCLPPHVATATPGRTDRLRAVVRTRNI